MVKYFFALSIVLLTGCASQTPMRSINNLSDYQLRLSAIHHWQLQGKIIVRSDDESEKAKFMWRNSADVYKIRLSGTLGMGTTYIKGDENSVRLEQNGKAPIEADTPEQLIFEQLGRDIPISQLHFWVRGLPAPDIKIDDVTYSDSGLIQQLQQAGWFLNYEDFSANGEWNLPEKIIASRDDIKLELFISKWTLDSPSLALRP